MRIDDKAPHQLLNVVFVTEHDGRFIGMAPVPALLRSDATALVEDLELIRSSVTTGTDLVDLTLMMADYKLIALAVTDTALNLVGAISVDDVIEAVIPEDWRARLEASTGV